MKPIIQIKNLSKTFTLHLQGGTSLRAFEKLNLDVHPGECLALNGPSGSGKSSLLRSLYANYAPQEGRILIRHDNETVDMVTAPPRKVLEVRSQTMGFVSQFLRVIPRIPAVEIVAEPLRRQGAGEQDALEAARNILEKLNIPERLWSLAPATFSGGEQQRVNVARGFIRHYPVLLLDEPTASLDAQNRDTVIELINAAKNRGTAVVGIFHDPEVRGRAADRIYEMEI